MALWKKILAIFVSYVAMVVSIAIVNTDGDVIAVVAFIGLIPFTLAVLSIVAMDQ